MINFIVGILIFIAGEIAGTILTCAVVLGKESEQKLNGRTNIRKTK